MSKADRDNRSNQLNPNNDTFYQSRGYDGRPDDDDDDNDDCGGYRGSTYCPPPPPSPEKHFLEKHSALVKQAAAALRIEHPSLDLCDFLMRNHPYFVCKDMGWRTAVIVYVLGCDIDSDEAAIIKVLASIWRESSVSKDTLTVFRIEFHPEG
jgi:hypothetical protein